MAKRTKFQVRSDAAKKRWHVRDDQKESFWRGHLDAWRKSGLSKRRYAIENDLAYSSFTSWNREIELRDRETVPPGKVTAPLAPSNNRNTNPFVPIRILPENRTEQKPQAAPVKSSGEPQQIEISLPSGAVMRLHDGCDPSFIARLLSCLKT
jgi:hypothetical protein